MLVIFTDLDGSLLNHEDYSYKDAIPSLERIKKLKIPLIFTSSKTRVEIELLQKEIGIKEPFIVENGAAVFFPEKYRNFRLNLPKFNGYRIMKLGKEYSYIRKFISQIKKIIPIKGFGDMSVEEIAKLTDLPIERARYAKMREFTEPFIIEDESKLSILKKEAEKYGLKITKGGRFYHLIGKDQDKGKAVKLTSQIFKENLGDIKTVGIGDSKNDISMLEVVDIPVLIPKFNMEYENIWLPNLIKASFPGSKGWNEVVWRLIDEFETACN
ncbi:glucosyl-3-phosphoglycerate phosphatase [Persephonella hydrogeniphila]|uniref:Glucosyl-3-phosphoglycerate phosphatase n=1 Tax=Persephonella hydrogeniphila TaxID=198703 RepID=A0A285N283_9AQUI|nr:HAD-IIB family hydrolase [Persephonella hydrogeniphila]SNZ03585.1 glucosyl-3-phosphoglycerate phosphatase [Persephonella hydrogeniphila]